MPLQILNSIQRNLWTDKCRYNLIGKLSKLSYLPSVFLKQLNRITRKSARYTDNATKEDTWKIDTPPTVLIDHHKTEHTGQYF